MSASSSSSPAPVSYASAAGSVNTTGTAAPADYSPNGSPVVDESRPQLDASAATSKDADASSSSSSSATATPASAAATPVSTTAATSTTTAATTTTDASQSNSASNTKKSNDRKSASFTPAPVPVVNAWSKGSLAAPAAASTSASSNASTAGSSATPGSSPATNSSQTSRRQSIDTSNSKKTKPLDPQNWPKPDEKASGSAGSTGPKVRSGGREKWVPYSGPVGSTKKPNNQSGGAQQGQKFNNNGRPGKNQNAGNGQMNGGGRKGSHIKQHSQSGVPYKGGNGTTNSNNNNNGNNNNQHNNTNNHVKQAANGKNNNNNNRSPTVGQAGFKNEKRFNNNRFEENGNSNGNGHFQPYHNNNYSSNNNQGYRHNRGGFRQYQQRPMHFNGFKNQFFVPIPDAVAAAYMYPQQMLQPGGPVAASNQYEAQLSLVVAQVEYYLSVENLCKDIFLRRQMNSQGLLPLKLIASFNRLKSLTGGNDDLFLEACRWAPNCEVVGSKIRPRVNWEQWVMPEADRLDHGRDETDGGDEFMFSASKEEVNGPKLEFNAAAAQPFVPKSEQQQPHQETKSN